MKIDQLVSIRRGVNKTRDADDRYNNRFLSLTRDFSSNELVDYCLNYHQTDEENRTTVFDMKKKYIHSSASKLEPFVNGKHLLQNNDIIVSSTGKDIYLYQGADDVVCVEQNFLIIRLLPEYKGVADKIIFSLFCYIANAIERIMKSGSMQFTIDLKELRLTNVPDINELKKINDVCKTSLELLNLLNVKNMLENELIGNQLTKMMKGNA